MRVKPCCPRDTHGRDLAAAWLQVTGCQRRTEFRGNYTAGTAIEGCKVVVEAGVELLKCAAATPRFCLGLAGCIASHCFANFCVAALFENHYWAAVVIRAFRPVFEVFWGPRHPSLQFRAARSFGWEL